MSQSLRHLMREYLDDNVVQQADLFGIQQGTDNLPLVPEENKWTVLDTPRRYYRKYKFKTNRRRNLFLNEVLKLERDTGHDVDIQLSKGSLSIETYTHVVNDITEIDLELAREFDNAYRDVMDYGVK